MTTYYMPEIGIRILHTYVKFYIDIFVHISSQILEVKTIIICILNKKTGT